MQILKIVMSYMISFLGFLYFLSFFFKLTDNHGTNEANEGFRICNARNT